MQIKTKSQNSVRNWRSALALGTAGLLACAHIAQADVINIGDQELLYTDAQLPLTMDASFATLKRDSNTMEFFQTDRGISVYPLRYHGSLANPVQTRLSNGGWDFSGIYTGGVSGPWLPNIYDNGSGTLIGLIHTEDFSANTANFSIGLAKSTDGGANWKFLGHVLRPYSNNASMALAYCSNIGGIPYLIVGDYMYVYFNEHTAIDLTGHKRLAVARALVSDIMTAAASNTVPVFHKYAGGAWTEDGLTGLADNVIPDGVSSHLDQGISRDFHSDAAYCAPLGKYLITVQTHAQGKLLLFTSTDGLNWGDETVVDYVSGYSQPYSTFASLNDDASVDGHVVGSEFYLIYPHKNVNNYNDDTLFRRRITIDTSSDTRLVWNPNGNGTDGAGTWSTGDQNWTNPATGGANIAWGDTASDTAVFGVANAAAGLVTVSGTLTLGDITFDAPGSGTYTLSDGTLNLAGNPSVILTNADAAISSALTGTGLIKNGRSTLTLSGSNTISGPTTVNAGTLSITGGSLASSSAINVFTGATLTTNVGNTFGVTPTAPWIIAGTITGTADAQSMPASVTLHNGRMSGTTFATYGTFLAPDGATITASGNNTINAGNLGLAGTLTLNTPSAGDALTISSVLGASSAKTGGLNKTGAGTVTLSGANIYSGDTSINAGTLSITGGSIASSSAINVLSDATLTTSVNNTFGGTPTAPWTISGTITGTALAQSMPPSVTLNNGTMSGNTFATYGTFLVPSTSTTITANGGNNTINAGNIGLGALLTVHTPGTSDALVISSVVGASSVKNHGLTKTGAGTLTLSAENIYTGATTIDGGTLNLTGSLPGADSVSVNSGGTLAGTGTVAPTTTVASGGAIAPGDGAGAAGTLTLSGGLTLGNGATLNLDLADTATSDRIAVGGTFSATGTTTIHLSALSGFAGSGTYPLLTGASGINAANFVIGTTPAGYVCTLGADGDTLSLTVITQQESWRLTYFDTTANTGDAADPADPDGDGMTNAQEFTAGTDPQNATSVFRVSEMTVSDNEVLLSFPTVVGKTYRLERSDSLLNGSWTPVQENILGTGGIIQLNEPIAPLPGKRFYRMVVVP